MMQKPLYLGVHLFLLATCSGCLAERIIKSTPEAEVFVLNENYDVDEELGKTPATISSRENLARFVVERGKVKNYLLVLYPESVKGSIAIDLRKGVSELERKAEASDKYSSYFDRLLRAHRLVLKGNFVNAKRLIQRIESDFDVGFGTAVLLGNIALLDGNLDEAGKHFRIAHELRPKMEDVTKFVPRTERIK